MLIGSIGKAWETRVAGNSLSFEEVYNNNSDACPTTLEDVIADSHNQVWRTLSSDEPDRKKMRK